MLDAVAPAPPRVRTEAPAIRPELVWALLPACGVAALLVILFARGGFPLDDAYITLSNARALIQGGYDPVFRTSALTGATSTLHLAAIALVGAVVPLVEAARLVTAAGVLVYAVGLWRMASGLPAGQRALLAWIGLFAGFLPVQLINGLETGWAMAAVAWAVVLADDPRLPLLCGVLPALRPELSLLSAPLLARYLWRSRENRPACVRALALAALAGLPFVAWSLAATGHPFGNTAAAKLAFFGDAPLTLGQRLQALVDALVRSGLLPLFGAWAWLGRARAGLALATFVLLLLAGAFATVPAALAHNDGRYLAVLVPVALAGLATLACDLHGRAGLLLLLAAAAWASVAGWHGLPKARSFPFDVTDAEMAQDVLADVPPGATVLVHDDGYIAWTVPDRHLIDLVGLKTPSSTAWNHRFIAGRGRRDLALEAIARGSGADFLVSLDSDTFFWGRIPALLRTRGWRVDRINPLRPHGYGVFRLTPPVPGR